MRADSRFLEQKTELEGEMGSHSYSVGINIPALAVNETKLGWSVLGSHLDDICRPFHPATKTDTFLLSAHRPFSKKDHILGH